MLLLNLAVAQKLALLIGNQDYDKTSLALKNPINDIEAIEETLEEIGFEVALLKNGTKAEMQEELDDFYEKAKNVEVALVYFSGHGLQVFDVDTQRVKNYLLPIEADVQNLRDLKKLIRLESLIEDSSSAQKSIVLIDACRDNPLYEELAQFFRRNGTKSATTTKGLGQVKIKKDNLLIGLATASNQTANDGAGDLSPYAKALSEHLARAGDISLVLRDVRDDVLKNTNNTQEPETIDRLGTGKLCLSGDCGEVRVVETVVEKNLNDTLLWVIGGLVVLVLIVIKIAHKKVKVIESIKGITIIDGLMYQNQPFTKTYTWEEAQEYAKKLRLGGYDDWRLPTRAELNKISNIKMYGKYDKGWQKWFNQNKHKKFKGSKGKELFVRDAFLENMQTENYPWFWTLEEENSFYTWHVGFYNGFDSWYDKTNNNYVLCVR